MDLQVCQRRHPRTPLRDVEAERLVEPAEDPNDKIERVTFAFS